MDSADILEEIMGLPGFRSPSPTGLNAETPAFVPLPEPPSIATPTSLSGLRSEEAIVLAAVERDETSIDRIILKCGLPTPVVSSTLFTLELKKLVKQLPGKHYVRLS